MNFRCEFSPKPNHWWESLSFSNFVDVVLVVSGFCCCFQFSFYCCCFCLHVCCCCCLVCCFCFFVASFFVYLLLVYQYGCDTSMRTYILLLFLLLLPLFRKEDCASIYTKMFLKEWWYAEVLNKMLCKEGEALFRDLVTQKQKGFKEMRS